MQQCDFIVSGSQKLLIVLRENLSLFAKQMYKTQMTKLKHVATDSFEGATSSHPPFHELTKAQKYNSVRIQLSPNLAQISFGDTILWDHQWKKSMYYESFLKLLNKL